MYDASGRALKVSAQHEVAATPLTEQHPRLAALTVDGFRSSRIQKDDPKPIPEVR